MKRIIVDCQSGERTEVDLTPEEEAEAVARTAAETTASGKKEAERKLREIDLASIRGLREYIAAQADAPKEVKDKEAEAVIERGKLK